MRLLLVLLLALAAAYSVLIQPVGCNQTAHYALTRALADGTPWIDRHAGLTCDTAAADGHVYAAKPPGLALLSLPWYPALDAGGALRESPALAEGFPAAMHALPRETLWPLHLLAVVPFAVLLVFLVGLVARRLAPGTELTAAALAGLGTLLLPYATDYYAHVPAAALGFAAFALLLLGGSALAAGVAAGLAVVVDLPLALAAAALLLYARGRAPAFAAGTALGLAPLLAYDWWAFGSPFRLPYREAAGGVNDPGFFGITAPDPRVALELLVSAKGLLTLSPVLAAAAVGLALLWRRGFRAEAALAGGVSAAYLVWVSGYWTPFGGFVPGPRFLLAAIPFLAVGLGPALRRFPLATLALGVVSIGAMTVVTAAEPALEGDRTVAWLERWEAGIFALSVVTLTGAQGGWPAVVPFLVPVAAAAAIGLATAATGRLAPQAPHAAAALYGWVVVLLAAPSLLRSDRLHGEPWGALATAGLLAAVGALVVLARRPGSLAVALPLAPLLLPGFRVHTKWSLLAVTVALGAAAATAWSGQRLRGAPRVPVRPGG